MPVHDWTNVDAGIFHHFHHSWIEEIQRTLNAGLLPSDCYALAEQIAFGLGPDVLTLQVGNDPALASSSGGSILLEEPQVHLADEADQAFYRSKQKSVVVRHVSGDRIVAVVEIVSQGNKSSQSALRSFLDKTT